jgi:mRNA interferase RelE/StbE
MTFTLVYTEDALSQLTKLDNVTAKRILDKPDGVLETPAHFFERLAGREEYKLRIGDYRVLAKILNNENAIFVTGIGHRKNIYKRLK